MSQVAALELQCGAGPDDAEHERRFTLLDHRFELVRQSDWLSLPQADVRRAALRGRACGRLRIDGEIYVVLSDEAATSNRPSVAQLLTQRELGIAQRITEGVSSKDIARQLGISHFTVAEYVRRICLKLKVRSRAAIATAMSQGL